MGLHKNTLAAALKRLAEFQGKPEAEVKAAIAADEKGFSEEEQAEIYAAFVEAGESGGANQSGENKSFAGVKHLVATGKSFADIADISQEWNEGMDVSHFAPDRLANLVELGLVTKA